MTLWCVWLTLIFAATIVTPEDVARRLVYLLLASWAFTGAIAHATDRRFAQALEQHAPDVARQIGSARNLILGRFPFHQRGTLALVRAVRTDPDLGAAARAHALAYWYPFLLFVLAIPGFAWMSQR